MFSKNLFCKEIDFGSPQYDQSIRLRDRVLRKPIGLSFTSQDLSLEWDQKHLAIYDDRENLLGILVFKVLDNSTYKMRQVAIDPDYQGKGIGSQLVLFAEKYAKRHQVDVIELHARLNAVEFYKKLAYKTTGKVFQEVNMDHYKMIKKL